MMTRVPGAGCARRPGTAGFSLAEVLIVIVIIGILGAIAIPMLLGQRERAKNANAVEGGHDHDRGVDIRRPAGR